MWSSGHSSWLQIQGSEIDSRRYQIFWEAVGLERGPLSLVSTTEELLERTSSSSGLESEITAVGIRRADHATPLHPQKLALTSPSGGFSVGIFRSWTKATELLVIVSLNPVAITLWIYQDCCVPLCSSQWNWFLDALLSVLAERRNEHWPLFVAF
jgi:hypothetical protein